MPSCCLSAVCKTEDTLIQPGGKGNVAADGFLFHGAPVSGQVNIHQRNDLIFLVWDRLRGNREGIIIVLNIQADRSNSIPGHGNGLGQIFSVCVNLQIWNISKIAAFLQWGKHYRVDNSH